MKLLAFICCVFLATNTMFLNDSNNPVDVLGLDIQLVSEQEKNMKIDALEISIIEDQQEDANFCCFTVDETFAGNIYIGFDNNRINVYSAEEIYLYTITFQTYGSYDIFCYDGLLYLRIVREDCLVSIDQNGNIVDVFELVSGSNYKNSIFFIALSKKDKYESGDKIYELGNNSAITSKANPLHANVKVTDENGNSHYMYYSSESKFWTIRIGLAFMFLFIGIISIKNAIDKKKANQQTEQ